LPDVIRQPKEHLRKTRTIRQRQVGARREKSADLVIRQ